MTAHHAQRLTAAVGLLATIILLLAAAPHVTFAQTEQSTFTHQSETY